MYSRAMTTCSVLGCNRAKTAKSLCLKHYKKMRKYGDPTFQLIAPRGSGCIANGYRLVWVNGRQVYEHRHIMEQHLGRRLRTDEQVHHIDKNRSNNALENLEIRLLGAHQAEHHSCFRDANSKQCTRCKDVYDRSCFYQKKRCG